MFEKNCLSNLHLWKYFLSCFFVRGSSFGMLLVVSGQKEQFWWNICQFFLRNSLLSGTDRPGGKFMWIADLWGLSGVKDKTNWIVSVWGLLRSGGVKGREKPPPLLAGSHQRLKTASLRKILMNYCEFLIFSFFIRFTGNVLASTHSESPPLANETGKQLQTICTNQQCISLLEIL